MTTGARRILVQIEDFSRRRYGLVFLVAALLVAGSVWLGRNLKLNADILTMLPQDNPEISSFVTTLKDFGSLDSLLVVFEAPAGQSVEEYTDLVDRFAAKVASLPAVEALDYKLDETSPTLRLIAQHAPLYLDDKGLDRLAAALGSDALRRRAGHLRETLANPTGAMLGPLVKLDPFGLLPIYYDAFTRGRGPLKMDLSSGYYISPDERALLVLVKPRKPPQDVAFSEKLKADIDAALAAAKSELAQETREDPAAGLTVKMGGGYIIAIEDSNLIKRDLAFNSTVSFFAVIGLYYLCYRRFSAIVYSVVPLIVGQALTFAAAMLLLGGLNNATAGFTAMLMGLGTDFTIVMYARYIEERRAGVPLATATHRMMGETALGVFTGAITSAGTFGAVCLSRFPGLRDFGFLVAIGILLCLVAILFLLPAMIAFHDGRPRAQQKIAKLHLQSFGPEKLLVVSDRYPRAVLAACAGVTLIAAWAASGIRMSDNYRDLRSPNNRGFVVQEEVSRRFGGKFNYMIATCHGADAEEALALNRQVVARLQPWIAAGDLSGYESVTTFLPDPAAQRHALDRLEAGQGDTFSTARISREFRDAAAAQGFREDAFDGAIALLQQQLDPGAPVTLADLERGDMAALASRYVKHKGGGVDTATYLFTASGRWLDGPPAGFLDAVSGGDARIKVTGLNVVGIEIKRLFRRDASLALIVGLVLVAVLLQLDFRSVRLTLYGLAQLVIGVVWMLGLMRASGIQMNFVNAFATTMILGVGIDYGIHLIHRIWEERSLTHRGVLETGKAVTMAALTNVAGFGTVGLSNYPAIHSMGLVCLYGTVCCLVTSLTLLPALMKLSPEKQAAPPPSD